MKSAISKGSPRSTSTDRTVSGLFARAIQSMVKKPSRAVCIFMGITCIADGYYDEFVLLLQLPNRSGPLYFKIS